MLFLSGLSTLILSCASLALCLASAATIIDHYDKRQNEQKYILFKRYCYIASASLFALAPIVQATKSVAIFFGYDIFPDFHGFAESFTFYSSAYSSYAVYLTPIQNRSFAIAISCFIVIAAMGVIIKIAPKSSQNKAVILTSGICFLTVSFLLLVDAADCFISGKVMGVSALTDPAKFNAILLTNIAIGFFTFMGSILVTVFTSINIFNKTIKLVKDS